MTLISAPFNVDLTRRRRRCHHLHRRHCRCRAIAIAAVVTAAATAAAVAAAAATNAVSVAVAAICWLIVVCPRRCLCFHRRCLPPPLPPLAADFIGVGSDCGNGCGGNGGSGDDGAFRSSSGLRGDVKNITY